MHHRNWFVAWAWFFAFGVQSAGAQVPFDEDKNRQAEITRTEGALYRWLEDREKLPAEMPLAKYLAALEKTLAKNKDERVSLRIDEIAFGDRAADVANMPVKSSDSLLAVLSGVMRRSLKTGKPAIDYGIRPGEILVTTPERAVYRMTYDIREFLARPGWSTTVFPSVETFNINTRWADSKPGELEFAGRAAEMVRVLLAEMEKFAIRPIAAGKESIQLVNGRLVIWANADCHLGFARYLQMLDQIGKMAVEVETRLYEVDADFHSRLKKGKRFNINDLEEIEQQILAGKPQPPLFGAAAKQKLLLTGEKTRVEQRSSATVLSQYRAVTCGPHPVRVVEADRVKEGHGRQTVLEGFSISAQFGISADRRSVWMKLTENASVIEEIQKVKIKTAIVEKDGGVSGEKEMIGEIPYVAESSRSEIRQIPDGASMLIPLNFRPRSAIDNNRLLVLLVTPIIAIEAEREQERENLRKMRETPELAPLPTPLP